MKVIIASYNLIPEKSHLMPWRYVCEVANYFNNNGHQAIIVSIGDAAEQFMLSKEDLVVRGVRKKKTFLYEDISALVSEYSIDVIIWPVSWREKKYRLQVLRQINKPVVGYFPGGMYTVKDVIYAARNIGLRESIPYILEVISPKKRQLKKFRDNGVKKIITLTDWTAQCIEEYGWAHENVTATLPGKESSRHDNSGVLPDTFSQWLKSSKYLVFMGPPTPIRGGYELLKAFDQVADLNASIKLVCLFRSDIGVDPGKMKTFINTLNNTDRIYIIWESLDRQSLETFISHSFAIALPFVMVPSEIPLALIDAASYGKPVITTNCGGSGKYVEKYGVTVELSKTYDFKEKIIRIVDDEKFYSEKCSAAKRVYDKHPTWDEMSALWLNVAEKAIAAAI